jgi:rod shape-determining protein MreD
MNRTLLNNVLRFIGLLGLQIFLFDRINFLGYINPMIYILFIILFPVENKRWSFMILAFALGIVLDTFQDTGGAHAAASLTLAFTRPIWLRLVYGESYKMKNLKVIRTPMDRLVLLMVLCITVHHLVFFSLVIFNTSQILYTLKLTLSIGLASLILNILLLLLFKPRFKA